MSIDFQAALRKRKPEKRLQPAIKRPASRLVPWTEVQTGKPLLLDTNFYLNDVADRVGLALLEFVKKSLVFHCAVALSELAIGVGNGDPRHPAWPGQRDHYASLFLSIQPGRILTPDAQIWADAGLIAGTLARTQGFAPAHRRACLNDALILLTAAKAGMPVLTADRDDFDLIQQIAPDVCFIHY